MGEEEEALAAERHRLRVDAEVVRHRRGERGLVACLGCASLYGGFTRGSDRRLCCGQRGL